MELPKAYNPGDFEEGIYKRWEKSGAFTPKIDPVKKPFVISMPPPNVTGRLHIGHALFITLQDIATRYHRMKGDPTLWLPGTDHAGIATQSVVEKALKKEGTSKRDLGREKFIERAWQWKEKYGGEITNQFRRMGASCDWSREQFTLDEGLSDAVTEAFVRLYDKGLIYRGEYIVNWCPGCQSAISDDEVEHKERKATFYYFKYDKDFPITIATTRPETKLGDTAVAVNPSDARYKKFVGKEFDINLDGVKRKIKVVADRKIDKKFGTGAVGVTPAHSMIDSKLAEDHGLESVKIINGYAKMTDEAGKYAGQKVKEARANLVEYLEKEGLIEKTEEIENNLSVCYRCNSAIEPIPSLQWFVKVKPLAEKAKKAVQDGEIEIIPKRFEKVYFHWLDNIHDWCISRQLWWGHRIPVYYRKPSKLKVKNQKACPERQSNGLKVKIMGIAERVVPQILEGKTKTYRIRDHELSVGDKVYFKNSQTEEIFGYGVITESQGTKVKDLPLQDKAHGAVYKNTDELIEAFKFHNPGKEVNPDSDAWIYGYDFVPVAKFDNSDLDIVSNFDIGASDLSSDDIYVGDNPPKGYTQDEDVLDTWFSSALWPFSSLGWPDTNAPDYKYFYPTTVMETGYDILFFWVTRMAMMGLELTGKAPFKTVYLHGLVRDEHNRKMSKSLGNGIDPIDVSTRYGTDAVRMSLVVGTTAGNDSKTGESKIKGYRNFSNKIWNIARFILSNLENIKSPPGRAQPSGRSQTPSSSQISNYKLSKEDKKDLKQLDEIVKKTTKQLDNLQFSQAGELLYSYTWHEFADKIIEQSKPRINGDDEDDKLAVVFKLYQILETTLKLLHPFMPFVTEAIWGNIDKELRKEDNLISSSWPAGQTPSGDSVGTSPLGGAPIKTPKNEK